MDNKSLILRVLDALKTRKKVYIYGAGSYGQDAYEILNKQSIRIECFITTKESGKYIKGLELKTFEMVGVEQDAVYLIGASKVNTIEIFNYLIQAGVKEEQIIKCVEFFEGKQIVEADTMIPTLEVTTVMGCVVNCKYCPQALLLSRYFGNNKDRERVMSVDLFKKCVEHMPDKFNITFGGMSEPFQNPYCIELIRIACEKANTVELYTTLNGVMEDELNVIYELPINLVNLHLADKNRNAKIIEDDNYYKKITKAINYIRNDGSYFVNLCSSQGEVSQEVKNIVGERCSILTELQDRAGNLSGENLIKKTHNEKNIKCSFSGKRLDRNILLPDGTLLLCCMDYGMEHVLGNLKKNRYDEIMRGTEILKVRDSLIGIGTSLCRNCSLAR